MQVGETQWSAPERKIANDALEIACQRETDALIREVKNGVGELNAIEDLWRLHDFLSARRHYIDGKYDDSEAGIVFVLAGLVKEGWLSIDELDGLDEAKLAKITALNRFF